MVVAPLGIENSYGTRQRFIGHMVVADDEIDAKRFGIGYFLDGFDAAVEHDDKPYAGFCSKIHSLFRDAVPLFIPVGDVEVDV